MATKKQTYNPSPAAFVLLEAAREIVGDKSLFLNRCIETHGAEVMRQIDEERRAALSRLMGGDSRGDSPPKRKAS